MPAPSRSSAGSTAQCTERATRAAGCGSTSPTSAAGSRCPSSIAAASPTSSSSDVTSSSAAGTRTASSSRSRTRSSRSARRSTPPRRPERRPARPVPRGPRAARRLWREELGLERRAVPAPGRGDRGTRALDTRALRRQDGVPGRRRPALAEGQPRAVRQGHVPRRAARRDAATAALREEARVAARAAAAADGKPFPGRARSNLGVACKPMWLAVGALLAVACVLLVARPFLRNPAPADDRLDEPDAPEQERVVLAEERDRALAALKELEFDHRTGKVSDDDYRAQVGPLRRQAAEVLRALESGEHARRERVADPGQRVP